MICLLGMYGSDKHEIADIIVKKYNYERIVSYTNRHMKSGEEDGITYNYISKNDFIDKILDGFFIEYKHFDGYTGSEYYGIAKQDIKNNSVCILTPDRLKTLKENIKKLKIKDITIDSFYIISKERSRIKRRLLKNDTVDYILRKIKDEYKMFKGIENNVDFIISNDYFDKTEDIADMIVEALIGKKLQKCTESPLI